MTTTTRATCPRCAATTEGCHTKIHFNGYPCCEHCTGMHEAMCPACSAPIQRKQGERLTHGHNITFTVAHTTGCELAETWPEWPA